jgi:Tol biopolymer transport system component
MIYHLDTKTSVDVIIGSVNQSIYSVANLFPTWSEDDTQIAFTSDRGPQTDIYIISSDGKYIFRVTETEAVEWDLDWTEN